MAKAPQPKRPQKGAPQQGPAPRILRVGIVLGGNIIEERLLRTRETVTLGQSANNTFSIPIESLPKSFPIFAYNNGRYTLHFTANMDGRVSASGGVHTLAQLKQSGGTRQGEAWTIPLDDNARGKVSVGSMTLLFQLVTAPPLQPRPRLPMSVRGSLADRIDPKLAIILTLSVLVHFGVALYAYNLDRPVERPVDVLARDYQVGLYEEPEPVEVVPEEADDGEETEAPAIAATPTKKPVKARTNEPTGEPKDNNNSGGGEPSESDKDAQIEEGIANTAMMAVLTGGADGAGMFSEMNGTNQGASLDDSIAHAKGKSMATAGKGGDRRQRGQSGGKMGTDRGQGVTGPSAGNGAVGGKKKEDVIKSRTKIGRADDLSLSDLDPASVVKRIRGRYLGGIKACHQRVLKIDPQAAGKVKIRFTVGPTGRVTKASVKGFDPTVDACIKGLASKWRFSAPKDDGKPVSADFEVPLLLKPGA